MHHQIQITDFAFIPESAPVSAGDTVSWINNDEEPHTATAENGEFDTGEIAAGAESAPVTIANIGAGGIDYHCDFHPHMTGKLTRA